MKNIISNTAMVKVLLREYLSRGDIGLLLSCGKTKSSYIINAIHQELTKRGIVTVRGIVSTKAFMEYMNWDLVAIIEKAKIEQILKIS